MVSTVANMAIDCANPYELARFWSEVTGQPVDPEDGPGDTETAITLPNGTALYFNQVPEPKTTKNRLHLCLRPDTSRDAEVERLLALGAPWSPTTGDPTAGGGPCSATRRATSSASSSPKRNGPRCPRCPRSRTPA